MKKHLILILLVLITVTTFVYAGELSDLSELSDNQSELDSLAEDDGLDGLSDDESTEDLGDDLASDDMADMEDSDDEADSDDESQGSVQFNGYLKALTYAKSTHYSNETWAAFQTMKANSLKSPDHQDSNTVSDVGARFQLRMEGYLGDKAKLFSAVNIDFNDAAENNSTEETDKGSNNGNLRLVEAFIELYAGNSVIKVGPQLMTWGFMEGFEVPTDRVNARDYTYNSTEYEDSKLPANGILFQQPIGDTKLELLYIPVAKTDIQPAYSDYYFQGEDDNPEKKLANAKFAYRLLDSWGDLDWALSYVAMVDPQPDLGIDSNGLYVRKYHQVRSPGLDLQYSFNSWLAKVAYVEYHTEDKAGENMFVKNYWKKYLVGGEFFVSGNTINFYAGQTIVDKFEAENTTQALVNSLIGQSREVTNFISGHISANFLTGNALNITLLGAGYYDEDNIPVQKNLKLTSKYTISNGLDVLVSPSFYELADNRFYNLQTEVKYSF